MTLMTVFIASLYILIWLNSMVTIKGFIDNNTSTIDKLYSLIVVSLSILLIIIYSQDLP